MSQAVGRPLERVDGRQKVTGGAVFAAEIPLEAMSHAYLVQATIAKGRITAIDTRTAEAAPGVLAVITHENAPKMRPAGVFKSSDVPPKAGGTTAPILQNDRIHWHGQPIAVVVAETFEQARHAAALVSVEFVEETSNLSMDSVGVQMFRPEDLLGEEPNVSLGDPEAALEAAEVKVDRIYTTPRLNHNPMEPHAVTAAWEGDSLRIHDSSQYIFGVRAHLAEIFGLKLDRVRVTSPFVGGGFGTKGTAWPHLQIAAAASKVVGRSVKLPLTRAQMYSCTGFRSATEQRVAFGANRSDGKLTVLIHTGRSPSCVTNPYVEPFTLSGRHLYSCPNMHFDQQAAELDTIAPTYMRAPGECPGTFALESAIDELAYELGIDPVELRLRNEPDVEAMTGRPFSQRLLKEAYQLGAEKFGWSRRTAKPGSMRDGRYLVGMGVATAVYPVNQFSATARVRVMADGSAVVQCGTHEMGMGTATVQAQHAADELGLPVEKVRFEYGDTDLPMAAVSGGSATTISVGAAVSLAVATLKTELLKLAGRGTPLHGLKAEAVTFQSGRLVPADASNVGESIIDLVARSGQSSVEAEATAFPSKELKAMAMNSYGAQFCEVRVDPDLGEVRVTRFVGAYDVGRVLNPKTARSQFLGGIVMGLGMALMEETHVDPRNGRVVNANLAEYLVPTNADIPAIEAYWLDVPDPHTPMGAHGLGEIGITGVAAAVANAVYHATGRRVRDLPILPEKLI